MTAGLLALLAVLVLSAGGRPRPRRDPSGRAPAQRPRPRPRRRGTPPWARTARAPATRDWARFLDAVAAEIRGGTAVRSAAATVLESHQCDGQVVCAPIQFDRLARSQIDDADEAVVAQALCAAILLGGSTAAVVQAGANLLRERAAVRAEAAAHSAQARLSARVLTCVPLAFAAWSAVASATFRRALLTPVGTLSVVLGVLTNTFGWWWMRRIVDRAVT